MTTSPTLEAIEAEHDVEFTLKYEMDEIVGSADNGLHPDLLTWTVTLEASKYDDENDTTSVSSVAKMVLHAVDTDPEDHNEAFFALDSESDGIMRLAEATMNKWGHVNRVIAVDTVQVDEKYRGKGIAPIILAKALHRIGGGSFAAILEASPLNQEGMSATEITASEKALSGLWKRTGFTKVKGGYHYLDGDNLSVDSTERKVQAYLRKKR